jgi:hypothetical protein
MELAKGVNVMSDRKGRKSVNTRAADGTIARPDLELAKALEEVAQSLPNKFFIDEVTIEHLVRNYEKAWRQKSTERDQILNAIFDCLYGAYVYLNTNPLALEFFLSRCQRKGITAHSGVDLSDILIEFYGLGRSKKAKKYAAELGEAALQKIMVGDLAVRLGNVGPHGLRDMQPTCIKEMAEQFANRRLSAARPQDESPIKADRTERPLTSRKARS